MRNYIHKWHNFHVSKYTFLFTIVTCNNCDQLRNNYTLNNYTLITLHFILVLKQTTIDY